MSYPKAAASSLQLIIRRVLQLDARNAEDLLVGGRHIEPLPAFRLAAIHHVRFAAPEAAARAPHDRMLELEAVTLHDAVADGHSAGVARFQFVKALIEQPVAGALHSGAEWKIYRENEMIFFFSIFSHCHFEI